MATPIRANIKVNVIDSKTNKLVKVAYLKANSSSGFIDVHYQGRLYATFIDEVTSEYKIYVDLNNEEELQYA